MSMTLSEPIIYPEREGKCVELKEKIPDFGALLKTCVAFANCAGGEIILGVEDSTRIVLGIDDTSRDRIYDDFPNSVYDSVSPALTPQIMERNIGGVEVLVIKIYPGTKKPYFLKSAGTPQGIWVRVGSSTRRASSEVVEELIREQRRVVFDEESSEHDRAVLSSELLHHFYGRTTSERRLMADHILVASGDRLTVSNGGILMFCEKPQDYIPEAIVVCTRFAGVDGRNIIETTELSGPVPQLVDLALDFTLSMIERDYVLSGARLSGKYLVPAEAIREAIVNALVHRKYSIAGSVKIARFDDHLEIFSPGAFPGIISLANVGDGTTFLRNTVVARIARKMKLMEKLGIGIHIMIDSCLKAGLSAPMFSEDGDFVKVTFRFRKNTADAPIDRKQIIKIICAEGEIRPGALLHTPGMTRRSLSRMLSSLVKDGLVVRHGSGAGVRYFPA